MFRSLSPALILTTAIVLSGNTQADEWTQFRGTNANGIHSTPVATTWSDTQNLQWKTPVPGPGSSSPIISKGKIFVSSYSGYGVDANNPGDQKDLKRHLTCYDQKTGKKLWQQDVPARLPEDAYSGFLREHGYASSTPVSDGENVYVFFGKSGALGFTHDGKKLWQTFVGQESGNRRWGSGGSPILYKDKLIVNASEESQSIRALDTKTGNELWKAEASLLELVYTTPQVVSFSNGDTDIVLAAPREIWGLNPDNGKLRWYAETPTPGNVSPTVLVNGDMLYAFGGYPQRYTVALKGGGKGNISNQIKWTQRQAPYVPTPILHKGHFYWMDRSGSVYCTREADGEQVFQERLRAGRSGVKNYASPVMAGNHIYFTTRNAGTFVIEAKPEFKKVAQNTFGGDNSDFSATPALSGKNLYIRSGKFLYSISK